MGLSPRSIWDSESYESDPSCGNHYILVYEHAAPIALVQSARVTPNTTGGHPDMGGAQWALEFQALVEVRKIKT